MSDNIEKLAYKIGEGFQASSLKTTDDRVNAFHRVVTVHESSDLSFINGLVSTGLRGSALLDGEKLIANYNQILSAARQHLPLIVNTNARSFKEANNYGSISALHDAGCFQLIATSLQDEIFLTLIGHRIAELALIPGLIIADYRADEDKVQLPADNLIIKYLGNPDDHIECPTPAQEIIFGKNRRRVPNWRRTVSSTASKAARRPSSSACSRTASASSRAAVTICRASLRTWSKVCWARAAMSSRLNATPCVPRFRSVARITVGMGFSG